MSETKALTKKQSAVIEDLFTSVLTEQAILEKHHVRPREYGRWLADEGFTRPIEQRIAHAHRQSRIILARSATDAASRLVALTECGKEETARKACLDIIALHAGHAPAVGADPDRASALLAGSLTAETASRLLAALAAERQDRHDDLQQGAGI